MYIIRKKFKFEMAHILNTSYSKECQNIHGHSYTLEVIIKSMGLNQDGMVIDFKKLKRIVVAEVIEKFDHTIVISNRNQDDLEWVNNLPGRKVVVNYNPTAELMSREIYKSLYPYLIAAIPGLITLQIRLHETDTGYAEFGGA